MSQSHESHLVPPTWSQSRPHPGSIDPGVGLDAGLQRNKSMNRSRNRRSAKAAGARFEGLIAAALRHALDDDRIERRARNGAKDRGDIGGVRCHGQRLVIECKDTARLALPQWTAEAQLEAGNDDALVGVVVHKRHGIGDPMQQWVSMTLADFVAILTGQRVDQ